MDPLAGNSVPMRNAGLPLTDPGAAFRPGADRSAPLHLNCPVCGLTITPKASWLTVEHCPRCMARRHVPVRMFASTLPDEQLYATDAAAGADHLPPVADRKQRASQTPSLLPQRFRSS